MYIIMYIIYVYIVGICWDYFDLLMRLLWDQEQHSTSTIWMYAIEKIIDLQSALGSERPLLLLDVWRECLISFIFIFDTM